MPISLEVHTCVLFAICASSVWSAAPATGSSGSAGLRPVASCSAPRELDQGCGRHPAPPTAFQVPHLRTLFSLYKCLLLDSIPQAAQPGLARDA